LGRVGKGEAEKKGEIINGSSKYGGDGRRGIGLNGALLRRPLGPINKGAALFTGLGGELTRSGSDKKWGDEDRVGRRGSKKKTRKEGQNETWPSHTD